MDDDRLPPIDILHFDGHGVFDRNGSLQAKQASSPRLAGLKQDNNATAGQNTGYLLFEDEDGKQALIDAERLGQLLHQQDIKLVVLSACQSAMVAGDEPFGSVAARLTQTGIPAIIAMPYSVLITTTRRLFAEFYLQLARGGQIGASLENARRKLMTNSSRGERQRGTERVILNLDDWFVPNLYQSGRDNPLLDSTLLGSASLTQPNRISTNLPPVPEVGFFGRSRELWQIERAFVGQTRRLTIHGFGGQGKTALVQEAGRWLQQTGMFDRVCFIDYHQFQAAEAVSFAVTTLSTVLEQSFIDAAAATVALKAMSTLVILDNLESLDPEPLRELLGAAKNWSEAGKSRVLLTSRSPDFHHPDYATSDTRRHITIALTGLGTERYPDDALDYLQALMALPPAPMLPPPTRDGLVELCKLVDFHPLSLALLAQQLKTRRTADIGQTLERLLAENQHLPDKDRSLMASLQLSLERLNPELRACLPRLGVFQGGAFEDDLLAITGLGKMPQDIARDRFWQLLEALQAGDSTTADRLFEELSFPDEQRQQLEAMTGAQLTELIASLPPRRELVAGISESTWQELRQQLEATGLIQVEYLPDVAFPFLKFHPTLAPALWAELPTESQEELLSHHQERYYRLSEYLYQEDDKNPYFARSIARRELPNLMFAVRGAIDRQLEWAIEFVGNVNKFLGNFGLNRDRAALTQQAAALTTDVGSDNWFLARTNEAEQLYITGRVAAAATKFQEILTELGDRPSYNRCNTLSQVGRCLEVLKKSDEAAQYHRTALTENLQLDRSDGVKRQQALLQADLANVLIDMGDYAGARAGYEAALAIMELGDFRGAAVIQAQLGTVALSQGDLEEAAQRYHEAQQTFRNLGESAAEAIVWHRLGMVYREVRQWPAAEAAYRRSTELRESLGNRLGAASSWMELGIVYALSGNPQAAEEWYGKALAVFQAEGDVVTKSLALTNLADLLSQQPDRLTEARNLAEEALKIRLTLDPATAQLWTTYNILANIADLQQEPDRARDYRRQARQAKFAFAGTRDELEKFVSLMDAVAATTDAAARQKLESELADWEQLGWQNLVAAIRQIRAGEGDEDILCAALDLEDAMVVMEILARLAGEYDKVGAESI